MFLRFEGARRAILLTLGAAALAACSQVTQSPEDCTKDQFYDDTTEFCRACPVLTLPACGEGCGFALSKDLRGCTVAECDCAACPDGSFFDADRASCVDCPLEEPASCTAGCPQVGTSVDARGCLQPTCACGPEDCPNVEPPDCGAPDCCTIDQMTDDMGCPSPVCACPDEAPEGHYFDDDGVCRACEGAPEPTPAACTEG